MVVPGHSGMLMESWQSKVAASAVLVGFACARASFARQVEVKFVSKSLSHETHGVRMLLHGAHVHVAVSILHLYGDH